MAGRKPSDAISQSGQKSELIDGLKVLEPEPLQPEGECAGGTYRYIDRMADALPLFRTLTGCKNPISLDLETGCWAKGDEPDPFRSPIYLMSVSTRRGEACVFDIRSLLYEDEIRFRSVMQKFLSSNRFICHNGQFEQAFLKAQFGVLPEVYFDTFLASQLLTAGLQDQGNGLDDCYERHLDIKLDKKLRNFFTAIHPSSPLTNEAIAYSAGDVTQLKQLASILAGKLAVERLWQVWEEIEKPFLPILTKAKLAGVTLDVERLTQIRAELEEVVNAHLQRFEGLVGVHTYTKGVRKPVELTEPCVNIASPIQLQEWYAGAGLELESTDEATLAKVLKTKCNRRIREFTETVLQYRRDSKVLNTYVIPLLTKHKNEETGKIHPDWKQMVDTGRMACRNPNLQNIPSKGEWAKIRECFVSEPGYRLVVADYSQMELRILAELSGEPRMIEAFVNGEDLHSKTADALFGAEFTKDQRAIAKTFNFAVCYGSGPATLAEQADIPIWQAKQLLTKYFQTYPTLKEYLERSQQFGKDKCWCQTPSGRKRWFTRPSPDDEKYKQMMGAIGREAGNMPIQGCNADCTKIASKLFVDMLDREGFHGVDILMWVHDEIVVQSPTDDNALSYQEVVADMLKQCMIEAGQRYLKTVPVEVSVTIAERWTK